MRDYARLNDIPDVETAFGELRRRFVEGRLGLAEFEERVEALYSSRSAPDRSEIVQRRQPPAPQVARRAHPVNPVANARPYLFAILLLVGIWAMASANFFWPLWPMMFWGVFVFSRMFMRPARRW